MKTPKKKKRKRDYCTGVPDWLPAPGYIGETCCKPHDIAYAKGGNKQDRKQADKALRDAIYAQAKARGNRWRGWIVAGIYYRSVRLFGRGSFNWHD